MCGGRNASTQVIEANSTTHPGPRVVLIRIVAQKAASRPYQGILLGRKSMSAANDRVNILTVASCSNVRAEHRSHVVVSGSYGGRYNAFNAAKWPVRAVIMND